MIVAFALQAQTTVLINNWLISFISREKSGRSIALRQTFVLAVTVALSFTGGMLLDSFSGKYIGFAILFVIALVMAIVEIIVLTQIPDVRRQLSEKKRKWIDNLRVPVRNRPFMLYVIYVYAFYLLPTVADSFAVVFMMRYLELPYTATTSLQLIITLPQLLLLGLWGKIADRKDHRFTLIAFDLVFHRRILFLALTGRTRSTF